MRGSFELPIYYEDTDLSGFVYHSNYLKFFERAREHLIGIQFLRDLWQQEGMHFVVSRAQLEYKSPAKHGDTLVIESHGEYTRSPAITFTQNCFVREGSQQRLAVSGQVTIVALNTQNRPIRLPDRIVAAFQRQRGE